MNTRTKLAVAGAASVIGLGTVFGAVSAAGALDLDQRDDVVPMTGIQIGDFPGSAVTPSPAPTQQVPSAPAAPQPAAPAPAAPVGDSAPSPVSAASPASAPSAASAASAPSAD